MELLPQSLRDQLPTLGSTEKVDDPIALVRFFTPDNDWTWFALEFDQEDTFFGAVSGFEFELGYFSLSELLTAWSCGLPIGDLHFKPTLLD
jgi:hypothetical protein